MSAEEKAKAVVDAILSKRGIHRVDHADGRPSLSSELTAALLEAFAEGKRQSLSAEQERQAEARGRREALTEAAKAMGDCSCDPAYRLRNRVDHLCRACNAGAEIMALIPAPTEGEGKKRGYLEDDDEWPFERCTHRKSRVVNWLVCDMCRQWWHRPASPGDSKGDGE